MVIEATRIRFPSLIEEAQEKVMHMNESSLLVQLMKQIITVPDEAMARWALDSFAA